MASMKLNKALRAVKKGNLEKLEKVLVDKDPNIREEVAIAFGEIEDITVSNALVTSMRDPVAFVRLASAQSLSKVGFPGALEHIRRYLPQEQDEEVKAALVKAMDDIAARHKKSE